MQGSQDLMDLKGLKAPRVRGFFFMDFQGSYRSKGYNGLKGCRANRFEGLEGSNRFSRDRGSPFH